MSERVTPENAVEQYLASKKLDATQSTVNNHQYRLSTFIEWASDNGFHDMNDLSGMEVEQFKNWKVERGNIGKVTLKNHLHTFRVFLRYCENIEVVPEGIADKVMIPVLEDGEDARSVFVSHERAMKILDYLEKYQYASNAHVIWAILIHTGCRRSALYALDVEDWHPKESYLSFKNREGTPLKNRDDGQRNATITKPNIAEAIDDYIADKRHDIEDEYGREPLLTSSQGRLHGKTISKICYKVTRPCWYGEECPHDRNPEECEGAEYRGYSKCPSSVSSHPVRRSAITQHLNASVPLQIVSERVDCSPEVIEKHYREQNQEERREARKGYLDNI